MIPSGQPPDGLEPMTGPPVVAAVRRAGRDNLLLGIGTGVVPESAPAAVWTSPTDGGRAAAAVLVDAVGTMVGTQERRVAASLVVLGYAARLLGPGLAVLLRDGILLDLRPDQVRYAFTPATGFALTLPEPGGWRGPRDVQLARWCADVLDTHLTGLVDAVRAVTPVSAGLLWGNVASGLTGALRVLALDGTVAAGRCHDSGVALLRHGRLAGTGRLTLDRSGLHFRRRSCCLYYRLPGGGTCGDCPLPANPAQRSTDRGRRSR